MLRAYCLQRVVSFSGLSTQHDTVSTIQHSVGDVAALRTGGSGLLDHALQHLDSNQQLAIGDSMMARKRACGIEKKDFRCSRTCVAHVIGLPALLQRPIIIFWARKTFSVGISIPRSPRATMMPSLASMISSNLHTEQNQSDTDSYKLFCYLSLDI